MQKRSQNKGLNLMLGQNLMLEQNFEQNRNLKQRQPSLPPDKSEIHR